MKLALHQFKTDLRHLRGWLIALWMIFALQPWLGRLNLPPEANDAFSFIILATELVLLKFIVVRLVFADRPEGSSVWWKTRPLGHRDLFAAKTGVLLLGIAGPLLVFQALYWAAQGLAAGQIVLAGLELMLLAALVVFLLGALAALSTDSRQLIATTGFLAAAMVFWPALLSLAGWRSPPRPPTIELSSLAAAMVALLACFLAAWSIQMLTGRRRAGYALLALAALAFFPVLKGWPVDFLRPEPIAKIDLEVQLLTDQDIANPNLTNQVLWSHFKVVGLPQNNSAAVSSIDAEFRSETGQRVRLGLPNWHGAAYGEGALYALSAMRRFANYQPHIEKLFPSDTVWYSSRHPGWNNSLPVQSPADLGGSPPVGRFSGRITLEIFDFDKLAALPLASGQSTLMPGLRTEIVEIEPAAEGLEIVIREVLATQWFNRNRLVAGLGGFRSSPVCFYVTVHR